MFPKRIKIALVTPIYKNGDERHNSLLTNYRLISVLSCFSKLLEHIVRNRTYNFLVDNKTLYEYHFGFWAARSSEHAILQLASQIANSFNSGKLWIFIDSSKVFDTVDHSILMKDFRNME